MINHQAALRFRRLGKLTICAVYLVILVGGIVRASGAGMGCPDWPTCFGQWIPPTAVDQLPENYQETYAHRGYSDTQFNPIKTWTEYVNRLVGVTIGFCIMLTAWSSRIYLKTDKTIFYLSLFTLFLVGFQGWLGATVVVSNLQPFIITLHMLVALLIVTLLIYAITRSQQQYIAQIDSHQIPAMIYPVVEIAMALTLIQVAMGTQIRESVDLIAHQNIAREYWRDSLPMIFYVHRSFSLLILLSNAWITWGLYKTVDQNHLLLRCSYLMMGITIVALLSGVVMDRLGMPAAAQPIHLLMANLIFGIQFFIYICLGYSSNATIKHMG